MSKALAIKSMKQSEPELKYLTIEGIKVLLEQPDISTKYGRRDLALLSLMYDTGARVQEIADIRVSHIRFSAPATIRLTGKGSKTRVVPILSRTEDILKQYIKEFKIAEQGNEAYLFQNRGGQQLSRYGIGYILTKYTNIARKSSSGFNSRKTFSTLHKAFKSYASVTGKCKSGIYT